MDLNKLNRWAKEELSKILEDIPELKGSAYLVFSSLKGQCMLTANRIDIYNSFPEFFIKNEHHRKINELLNTKNKHKELNDLLDTLLISPDVFIEFRFEKLNYNLIEVLKKHPRIKQPENMMRPSWIRVILTPVNEVELSD
jgi:hypothetical protein